MPSPIIRPYTHERDEPAVHHLWQEALGATWPLSQQSFHGFTVGAASHSAADHLVAELDDLIIGFVATWARHSLRDGLMAGQIQVVMVAPSHQRQGIGAHLIGQALAHLRERDAVRAQLASGVGVGPYFWLGVPENLPGAMQFFRKLGWALSDTPSADMYQDLRHYVTPAYIWERVRASGVHVQAATAQDMERILAFEKDHFPYWYESFASHRDRPGEIVFAESASGQVVGTAMLRSPRLSPPCHWATILGEDMGTLNAVGVDESLRKQGIGLALCAGASEVLRQRGVRYCLIGGAWSVAWYAKLGYQVWRTYRTSRMQF